MRTFLTIILSISLSGCFKVDPIKLYSGPDLPPSELAVVDLQIQRTSPIVTEHIRSYLIDGRPASSKQKTFPPVLVREGRHQLALEVDIGDYRNSCSCKNKRVSLNPPSCSSNPQTPWLYNYDCKYSDYKMLCDCDYKSYTCEGLFQAKKGDNIGIAITGGMKSLNVEFEKIYPDKLITKDETNKSIKCKFIRMTRLEDLDFDDR